jgi:tetratricopeptide (TPR) repeat protein
MKTVTGLRAEPSCRWLVAIVFATLTFLHALAASESDYLPDDGERSPVPFSLDADSERQAEAMAHFITGVLEEEGKGPEHALSSYRRVLALDPGYTKLAIEVAYDSLRRGEATEAIGVLKDAIKAKPEAPEPALALASIYLKHLNKPDLATRYAEIALKADPGRFAAYESLWEIAREQGDLAGCNKVLERAVRAKTTSTTFWLQLADFLTNSSDGNAFSDPKTAAKLTACLEKAAQSAGTDGVALARIADFYVLNKQYEKSVSFYKKALDAKPLLGGVNEKLAGVLIELGRKNEAIPVLEAVIANNPLSLPAYDQLCALYQERGDHEKALRSVEQALIIEKANVNRQHDLMLLLFRTGRIDKVIERSAEACKLFPQVPFFTYVHARALAAARRSDEAMRVFERALVESSASDPLVLSGAFYFDYGCAAQQAGRYNKAAELFKKSIELDPENPDTYNALGYMWAEQKTNLDEAEVLIRKALAVEPANGAYLDSLGWLYYQKGKYDAALTELLRAAKALPEPDAVVQEHIGDAYRALNRTAEAVLYWQKSMQLDPSNKGLVVKIDAATDKVAQKPAP